MRIAAYQFAVSGNISENYKEIEKAIYIAKTENVRLLIFPECSLTGYPPRNISNASCVDFNLVQIMCDKLQSIANKMTFPLLLELYLKKKKYTIEQCCFSLIVKLSSMISVPCGDGIRIISQKAVTMEYLKWKG